MCCHAKLVAVRQVHYVGHNALSTVQACTAAHLCNDLALDVVLHAIRQPWEHTHVRGLQQHGQQPGRWSGAAADTPAQACHAALWLLPSGGGSGGKTADGMLWMAPKSTAVSLMTAAAAASHHVCTTRTTPSSEVMSFWSNATAWNASRNSSCRTVAGRLLLLNTWARSAATCKV